MDPPAKSPTGRGTPYSKRDVPFRRRSADENELLDEITMAARCIADARDSYGDPVFRTDPVWRVLRTVATSRYCLTLADLARALGVRKQVAHRLAHLAERAEVIELAPNPDDRRILQAFLTRKGHDELVAAKAVQSTWLATVLNGLRDQDLATAARVVRVIRQRLERDARELARRKANPLKS